MPLRNMFCVDIREYFVRGHVVSFDLPLLGKLARKEEPQCDVLGPGTVFVVACNVQCSGDVAEFMSI